MDDNDYAADDMELWNPDTPDGARRLRALWAMLQTIDGSEQDLNKRRSEPT